MKHSQLVALKQLLSQPTAPFRETFVANTVSAFLSAHKVPYFKDPIGNIVVGVASEAAYRRLLRVKHEEPVRLFVAHMDHPGFHGVRWLDDRILSIKWYGGSPIKHVAGRDVWLATDEGVFASGRLSNVVIAKHRFGIASANVKANWQRGARKKPPAKKIYGAFQFRAPVWVSGKRLYTKAADDLVGVFCILEIAKQIFSQRKSSDEAPPFIGLLTRGEEVGFVGAVGHFELGWYSQRRRPLVCVSLEASRTLPGAAIGEGPVVRLGDRRTVFDANGSHTLNEVAQKTLGKVYQRRIMDGGACEGTAATAWGIPTIAVSIPLGNYHNQGFEGGQDCPKADGPAPEFVHIDDVSRMLKLCGAIMDERVLWRDPWRSTRDRLLKNYRRLERLL